MSSDFDLFADQLEATIINEMRRDYSEKVVEIFLNPINMGKIENADGYGKVTGSCGDTMEIFLKIKDDLIVDTRFITDGCGTSMVCGCTVTELAKGRNTNETGEIKAEKVLHELGGLPEADQHCARLAADTLRDAITNYLKMKRGQV